MTILFPDAYDDASTLYDPKDDMVTKLASEWVPGQTTMSLEDASGFSASGGFATIYIQYETIDIARRITTFSYAGKNGSDLTGVHALSNTDIPRPQGSIVVGNIMAEHRMALTDAVIACERMIGFRATEDTESIEYFTNTLVQSVKKPKPYFYVKEGTTGFVLDQFEFVDQTYRLQQWQNIEWLWDFGDGAKSHDRNPVHVYSIPGIYSVSLTVTNEYGSSTIVANNLIKIMGRIHEGGTIQCDKSYAIANETTVRLTAAWNPSNPGNPAVSAIWTIEPDIDYPNSPGIYVVFNKGGVYRPKVDVRTLLGNKSVWSGREINVIERNSVWFMIQRPYAPNMFLLEFSPAAAAWKSSKNGFAAAREWNEGSPLSVSQENFTASGALHDFLGSTEALALWAQDKSTMHWATVDALTDTWTDGGSRTRGWGWASARTNWHSDTSTNRSQVYVFFGHMDPDNPTGQSAVALEHFGMITRTWETIGIDMACAGPPDEAILYDMANGVDGTSAIRVRSASWRDNAYIMVSDQSGIMNRFCSFAPITQIWTTLEEPMTGQSALNFSEISLNGINTGVAAFGMQSTVSIYKPASGTWAIMIGTPGWTMSSEGRIDDKNAIVKSTSSSECPGSASSLSYVSGWAFDAFGRYDEMTRSAVALSNRPIGVLSAMGVW